MFSALILELIADILMLIGFELTGVLIEISVKNGVNI